MSGHRTREDDHARVRNAASEGHFLRAAAPAQSPRTLHSTRPPTSGRSQRGLSFRSKVFWSIVVAVMAATVIEGTLDYVYQDWRVQLQKRTQRDLNLFADVAVNALALAGPAPGFSSGDLEALPRLDGERFRLVRHGKTQLSYGGLFPEDSQGWATLERNLGGGYRLEVASALDFPERIMNNEIWMDIFDTPLFFALAFGISWFLSRQVMRPVRELTAAFQQLSMQQFPEQVKVPPGEDELTHMARSFNVMSASIQSLIERERSFTRYASHELRTPLSVLKVHVESLNMGLASTEKTVPVLERNIRRMETALSALLTLARAAGHDATPTDVLPLVQNLLSGFPPAMRHRVTLLDRARDDLRITSADLVQQALYNLLDNALQYSVGCVNLILERNADSLVLRVCDHGPGIPEDALDDVTKPFVRREHREGGTGLGLALVESIARSLRGDLRLTNTDTGFEARLTLPIVMDERVTGSS